MKRRSARKAAESSWSRTTADRLDVFERSRQKASPWLDDLMGKLGWEDRHRTYEALGVVLHVLRDRLPLQECVTLGAQLPLLLRGLYYQNWDLSEFPRKYRHARDFLSRVRGGLLAHRLEDAPEERVTQAVTELLMERLCSGELGAVRRALPPEIRSFFEVAGNSEAGRRWLNEERAWDKFSR
jgi:uncharacterized protein (DUF2267 family)